MIILKIIFKIILKNSFTFPKPCHEDERMKCLLSAITHHYKLHEPDALAKIDTVESTTQTDGYSQFSGGGDLCLNADLETLVFNRLTEEDADSPIYQGTSASTTMSIEGKKDTFSYDKLKPQLFANMVVASVTMFINKIQKYDEKSVVTVDKNTDMG